MVSSPCGQQWEVVDAQVSILHGRGLECTEEAALGGSQSTAKAGRGAVGLVHGVDAQRAVDRALGSIIVDEAAAGTIGACAGCGERAARLKTARRKC